MTTSTPSRAPVSSAKIRRKVTRAGAIGNFIEFYDFTLYGFFSVTIAALFFPQFDPVASLLATFALFGVAFVIRPIGAMVFGHIGDRLGRKRALLIAVLLMSVATFAIGLLPTYAAVGIAAPVLLLLCRLVQGFSAGGEQTGAFVLVVEHSPVRERARNASRLVLTVVAGVGFAALMALLVTVLTTPEQLEAWGWRLPFLVSLPLGILGLYLRMGIEESKEFEIAKTTGNRDEKKQRAPIVQAFTVAKKQMLTLFGWVAIQSLSGYLLVGYMFSHLVQNEGFTTAQALTVLIIAHVVTMAVIPVIGRWADKVSRKTLAVSLTVGLIVWTVPAFMLLGQGVLAATVALAGYAALEYSTIFIGAMATVELFPDAEVRYTASAVPYQLSYVLFGGTAPFLATWMVSASGSSLAPAFYVVVVSAFAAVLAWKFIPNVSEEAPTIPAESSAEMEPSVPVSQTAK